MALNPICWNWKVWTCE